MLKRADRGIKEAKDVTTSLPKAVEESAFQLKSSVSCCVNAKGGGACLDGQHFGVEAVRESIFQLDSSLSHCTYEKGGGACLDGQRSGGQIGSCRSLP